MRPDQRPPAARHGSDARPARAASEWRRRPCDTARACRPVAPQRPPTRSADDRETGPLQHGLRFDILYDKATAALDAIAASLGGASVFPRFASIANHDERAAVVCALTALGVAESCYAAVGDDAGGWFFLPAWRWWKRWAKAAIDGARGPTQVDVWLDGQRFRPTTPLPP